jgi:hypothetical protein
LIFQDLQFTGSLKDEPPKKPGERNPQEVTAFIEKHKGDRGTPKDL